ncbi:MAG TPA: hypothetical protein VGB73_01260 [Pyrinomonadaceae bacterium]|jgi:hypothetical protein
MKREHLFIRNFEAGVYLESFLVAAVASVLVIRLFLQLTGYPQIGGGGLHIAHMLWGGLLMLVSIIVLLSFLSKTAELLAAIAGGIGFGTFIDEVGKFVTSDHNYFFRPAISLIYVSFILIFLAVRAISQRREASREEYLLNALRSMEEVALHDLDEEERRRALAYLEKSGDTSPLVKALSESLSKIDLRPPRRLSLPARLKRLVRDFYFYVAATRWFPRLIVGFFIAQLVVKILYVFVLIFFVGLGWRQILDTQIVGRVAERMVNLSFIDKAEIFFSLLSGVLVLWGIVRMRRSRLAAFRLFERSILVSIFLTQVFAFYKEQFSALAGLFLNIAILLALRYMIERERVAQTA